MTGPVVCAKFDPDPGSSLCCLGQWFVLGSYISDISGRFGRCGRLDSPQTVHKIPFRPQFYFDSEYMLRELVAPCYRQLYDKAGTLEFAS